MSCTTLGNWSRDRGLCPMSGLQVENNKIGEVGSMFVFTAEDEELVALVQSCRMS